VQLAEQRHGRDTFKRDYVARMELSNAATVLAQLPAACEHFNEVHPHSSLKMRSPREFRRHQAAQARRSTVKESALRCE
jgi:putative transposase